MKKGKKISSLSLPVVKTALPGPEEGPRVPVAGGPIVVPPLLGAHDVGGDAAVVAGAVGVAHGQHNGLREYG